MYSLFKPMEGDLVLGSVFELSGEYLASHGIRVLIADLDNTVGKNSEKTPREEIVEWVKSLRDNGISLAVVSNNTMERVGKFCEPLGIKDYYWRSGKPRIRAIKMAMERLGGTVGTTALVGDKYTTDVLGAKRLGIMAIKVSKLKKRKVFLCEKNNDN